MKSNNNILGFLELHETANKDGYLGSILITDSMGVPEEFRCTLPVKPTSTQKPLYGKTLVPYIGVKLCGIPLIKSVQNHPEIIIVKNNYLIDIRLEIDIPVVCIRRAGETIEVSSSLKKTEQSNRERLDSTDAKFQPIVIITHPNYDKDKLSAKDTIESLFNQLDPLEPFDRMVKAISMLSEQDKRFQ